MKKYLLAVMMMSAFVSTPLFAHHDEDHEDRYVKLSIDGPLALFGAYFLNGEFAVGERMSFIAALDYVDCRWTVASDVNQVPGWFIGAKLGARWYLNKHHMSGLFAQTTVEVNYGRTYSGTQTTFPPLGLVGPDFVTLDYRANFGYSFVTDLGFFFDMMAGLNVDVIWGAPNAPTFHDMVGLEGRVNIGWAF